MRFRFMLCGERGGTCSFASLTTQADVQRYAASILDEAVYTDAMPEGRDMALATREQLGEWLACGAP